MKHYSPQDLVLVNNTISNTVQKLSESVIWVEANLKYEEKYALLLKLKNASNTIAKISNNISSKPVIAIFGGSQVGKSYLIKNLLSSKGRPFVIENQGKEYDFLKDINPPGVGAESTGVVTRFTVCTDTKFTDFPVKINLLCPKDILIIVLDTFFLDLKKITTFKNTKELNAHISLLEAHQDENSQDYLSESDILEIKEYFENHLSKHIILFESLNETRFFERIGQIIKRFDYNEWNRIFNVLWLYNDELSDLFDKLISGLAQLHFEKSVYVSFDEVLRGKGEILDVKRLKELNSSNMSTTIKKENGAEIEINLSLITALSAELIFTIPSDLIHTKEFLKNSDLLDFPGARSRLAIDFEDIDSDMIPDMLLRGKVSYLFNKYSDDFNINNLLFCTNDKQLDVNEIPSLLFNWISRNIGSNTNERTLSLQETTVPPLFVVFTFFNNQLKFDTTNDFDFELNYRKLNYKWDTRFNRFFENEIVTQAKNWHTEWTKTQGNFQNFYLLRDFKYSTDSFEGFEENGYESVIRTERVLYLNKLKDSFLDFDFVKNHFSNPVQTWEQSSNLNQDGSELIINNLAKVSNNFTKTNHYINKVNQLIDDLKFELNKHLHTDDLGALRATKMRAVNEILFSLNAILAKDITAFNQLVKLFSIEPVEIYNLLNENIVSDISEKGLANLSSSNILLSQYPELNGLKSKDEVFDILRPKLYLQTNNEVEDYLISKEIKVDDLFVKPEILSKSKFYIDLVINYWISKINTPANSQYFTENGFLKKDLYFLTEYFNEIISIRKLKDKMEKILNDVVSEIYTNHGTEEFLAETFALIINDLVVNFDLNYFSTDEIGEIKIFNEVFNFKFYYQTKSNDLSVISNLFENEHSDTSTVNVIVLEKYNKWIENLRISLLVNCGFVNYNEQANENLKQIITGFDVSRLS